jgi:hypothetical protein
MYICTPIIDSEELIAICSDEYFKFGCPNCDNRNHKLGQFFISNRETQVWQCGNCRKHCIVLQGVISSTLVFKSGDKETRIDLVKHPFAIEERVVEQVQQVAAPRKKILGLF